MRAILVLAIVWAMPLTATAQSGRSAASAPNPSLLEVAARVQRIVAAHEEALAAEKATAPMAVAKASHKPKIAAPPVQRAKPTSRVGLSWRVSLVWPEELRESADTTASTPVRR